MASEVLSEFQSLSAREKFLTIAAIIAFPVDVVSLLGLLPPVVKFQRANPLGRPTAVDIGLPSFLWDTQIADALSLAVLLYSAGLSLVLFHRWNIVSVARKKLREHIARVGGRRKYCEIYKRRPTPSSEKLERDELVRAGFLAALPALAVLQPVIMIWLRVFVLRGSTPFGVPLMVALSLTLFTYVFFSARTDSSHRNFEGSIPRGLRGAIADYSGKIVEWLVLDEPSWGGCLLRIVLVLPSIVVALLLAVAMPLTLDGRRALKTILVTGCLTLPVFLFFFRVDSGMLWGRALLLTTGTIAILIPLLWGSMVMGSLIMGYLLDFLFTPAGYRS